MMMINEQLVSDFVQMLTSPCDHDARPKVMKLLVAHPKEADAAFERLEHTLQKLRLTVKRAARKPAIVQT